MHLQDFTTYKAVARLRSLAEKPYDLTGPKGLSADRIGQYTCSNCGFDLLYATQRVSDAVLEALQDLADEAGLISAFQEMKKGAVLNRIEGYASENRQVLHTASRDVFSNTPLAPEASGRAREELEKLRLFLDAIESGALSNAKGEPFTNDGAGWHWGLRFGTTRHLPRFCREPAVRNVQLVLSRTSTPMMPLKSSRTSISPVTPV